MRIDYNIKDKIDIILLISVVSLILIGLTAIFSSTQNMPHVMINFNKQLFSFLIGIIILFTIFFIPLGYLRSIPIPAYLISLFLLVLVLLIGKTAGGAKSWIGFGSFSFQPAEFAKFSTILALALFLSKPDTNLTKIKDIFFAVLIGLSPVGLILLEPDLGSSIVFFGFTLIMMVWKGIDIFGIFIVISPIVAAIASLLGWVYFLIIILLVLGLLFYFRKDYFTSGAVLGLNLAIGFFVDYFYDFLSPHQQKRIESFINPMADPLGAGYNSIQAQVAIGSGGFWGKGFLQGNQTQLQFIPEQWTDFIFCVIGEEFGFIGSTIMISLYIVIFVRIIKIAISEIDEFNSLVLIGIFSIFFIHFIINIGMTIGLIPIIGIPLPFISYGGSSLLINLTMLGIALNIHKSRKI